MMTDEEWENLTPEERIKRLREAQRRILAIEVDEEVEQILRELDTWPKGGSQ